MNDIGKRGSISFSEIFAQEEETKKKNKEIINKIKFKTTDSINSIGGKIDDIKGNEGYLMINGKFIKNEDIFFELDGEKNPNYPGSTFLAGKIKNIMEKNLGLSKEFDETNLAHSEQIMIAHLMDILRLKTNKEKINVKIFTFRPCCSTCYETIEEFNKIYKNDVNLEVIDFGYDKSDFTKKPSNYYTKGNGIFKNIDDIDDLKILESFDEINNGRKTINFGNTTLIGNKEYTIESLKFKTNNIEAINNEEVKKKSEELEAKIKEFRSKFDKFRKEVEKLERYKGEKLNKIHSRELRELEEIEKLKIKELNSDKQKIEQSMELKKKLSVEKIKKEKNEAVKGLEEKINKKVKELEQTKNELESEKEKIEKLNKELIDNIKSSTLEINQQIESENSNESENKNKKKYVYIDVKHYPANPSLLSRLLAKATDDITKKLDQAKEIKI